MKKKFHHIMLWKKNLWVSVWSEKKLQHVEWLEKKVSTCRVTWKKSCNMLCQVVSCRWKPGVMSSKSHSGFVKKKLTIFRSCIKFWQQKKLSFCFWPDFQQNFDHFFSTENLCTPVFRQNQRLFGPKNVENVPVHLFFFKHLPQPKRTTSKKAA